MGLYRVYISKMCLLWFTLLLTAAPLFAQERGQEEGEIVEGEVIIDKNLDIELPPANRVFEKVPPRASEAGISHEIKYDFKDFDLRLPDLPVRLRVLKLKQEKTPVYSGNFLTLGFGNYLTPYLDFGLNSSAKPSGYYGVHLQHISSFKGPVDKDYSAESNSSLAFYGKYTGGTASIHGRAGYDRQMVHFYGYPDEVPASKDTLKQVFNRFDVNFKLKNNRAESRFDYELGGGVNFIKDKFVTKETAFDLELKGSYDITEGIKAGVNLDFLQDNYQYGEKVSRTLFRGTPYAVFNIGDLKMDAGMNMVYLTDTLNYKSNFKIFPRIKLNYAIRDLVNVYAGLDGDVEAVTFNELAGYNPYLRSGVQLTHSARNMEIFAGVRGHIIRELSFDAGFKAGNYKNLYYFINDSLETNKFDVVYDGGNANVFKAYVSLSYIHSDLFGVTGSLNYYGYGTKEVEEPWHRPSFETAFSVWYSFHRKVRLSADLFTYSGMKALDYRSSPASVKKLDPVTDLNVKADYMFSKRYGAFLSLNNLLGKKYSYYLYYPVKGFQVMIGVKANF